MTTIKAVYGHKTKLAAAFKECIAECDKIGIPYQKILEVSENTRAKSRWGQCRRVAIGQYTININTVLLDDSTPLKGLKETLLHEICHTVDGGMSHTGNWLKCVTKLNKAYGYNIKRTDNCEDKGIDKEVYTLTMHVEYKYVIRCKGCGNECKWQRMSKAYQNPERYRCGICRGQFERV